MQRSTAGRMESALLEGIESTRTETLGVETSGAEPSSIGFFQANEVSSVDAIDLASGKLAAVLVLQGAEGDFGVKGTADSLLPDLLAPQRP